MIGTKRLNTTAGRPNFPLGALYVRAGSAANVALLDVPSRAGVTITGVTARVMNCDGQSADFAADLVEGKWVVDIPASHFGTSGTVEGGVAVLASGLGADGETPHVWNVGVGDLCVLGGDAPVPSPGTSWTLMKLATSEPSSPVRGVAYISGATFNVYDGSSWVSVGGSSVSVSDIAGGKRVTVVNRESTETVDVPTTWAIKEMAKEVCLPTTTESGVRVVGAVVGFAEGLNVLAGKAIAFFSNLVTKVGDIVVNATTSRPAWRDSGNAVHDLAYKSEIPTTADDVGALEYEWPHGTFKAVYDPTTGKWGFLKQGAIYALPAGEGANAGGTFAMASDVSAKLDASNGTATNLKADGLKKKVVVDTGRMSVTYGAWSDVEVSLVQGSSTDWQPQDQSFTLKVLTANTCAVLAAGSETPTVLAHAETSLPWTLTAVGYDTPVGSVSAVTETAWKDVATVEDVASDYVMRIDPETGDIYYTTP